MTDLADLVEAYKREAAVPGTFDTSFPNTTDEDIEGALADAFAEAQLDGFFGANELDVDAGLVTPDISTAGAALVVIYAGMRVTRQLLRDLAKSPTYKAGPVEYSVQAAASVLTEELKALRARRDQLLLNAVRGNRAGGSVFMIDAYISRAYAYNFYGGFLPGETTGRLVGIGG